MQARGYDNYEMTHRFLLPTHDDIHQFVQQNGGDDVELSTHLGRGTIPSDAHDEDWIIYSSSSPPNHRDLVDLLQY